MLEGERLACDGRQCFTHFYYIIGIGPSILVNDSSARDYSTSLHLVESRRDHMRVWHIDVY